MIDNPLPFDDAARSVAYVDLFCGLGGFRVAINTAANERNTQPACVFSCDIDPDAQRIYATNFGEIPCGDITVIAPEQIPPHRLLFAGFPCQPFSICGDRRGFDDVRGTLFFDIARILRYHRPEAFVLENVKLLVGHDGGRTLRRMMEVLTDLGYQVSHKVLNALHFGLPQKRERVFIVGFREARPFRWPQGAIAMRPLADLLEANVPASYHASPQICANRQARYTGPANNAIKNGGWSEPTIWHENKGGHISAYPFSCALRAGASYNYLLVNGERRLTERELLRLQGFPESYQMVGGYSVMRRLAGNSVAVPCVAAVIGAVLDSLSCGNRLVKSVAKIFRI